LSSFRVTDLSVRNVTPQEAFGALLAGTPWKADIDPTLSEPITMRSVTGPTNQVVDMLVDRLDRQGRLSMVQDAATCTLRLVQRAAPIPGPGVTEPKATATTAEDILLASPDEAPAPAVPEEPDRVRKPGLLPKGKRLSEALAAYVEERGWTLRWNAPDDYVLDVEVPVPAFDLIDGVTWVVEAYQAQGGLPGVVPRFARGNRVVVIEPMQVREVKR
jgi:hypothetical protein